MLKRIIVLASALAFFATSAVAENQTIDHPDIQYKYTYNTIGSGHFCDLATLMMKGPITIKFTAAVIGNDAKPKDQDISVLYIVEALAVAPGKKEMKVVAGRIISDDFNSDLNATKNNDKDLGASYTINNSEASIAHFMNLMALRGEYTLVVELENRANIIVKVRPTGEMPDAAEKWRDCINALRQHQPPQMAEEKAPLVDEKTKELTPRGLAIQLVALAQVVEMQCNIKGLIKAALAKADKAGIIINLNDKEDFADELFMASQISEKVKKTGAEKWCEKTAPPTVQYLAKP